MTRTFPKDEIISSPIETDQSLVWLQAIIHSPLHHTSVPSLNGSISRDNGSVVSITSLASTMALLEVADVTGVGKNADRYSSQRSKYSGRTTYEAEIETEELNDSPRHKRTRTGGRLSLDETASNNITSFHHEQTAQEPSHRGTGIPSRRSSMTSRTSFYHTQRPPSYYNTRQFQSIDGTLDQIKSQRERSISSACNTAPTAPAKPVADNIPQRRVKPERSLSTPPPPTHTTLISTLPPRPANGAITPPSKSGNSLRSNFRHSAPSYSSPSQNTAPHSRSLPTSTRNSLDLSRPSSSSTIRPSLSRIPTSQTLVLDWTSPQSRRAEYAKIDQCHSGIRGLWKRIMPKCMHHRRARRGFWDEGAEKGWDADTDSVRRFRVAIEEDDSEDEREDEDNKSRSE